MSAAKRMPTKTMRTRALAKLLGTMPEVRDEDECRSCDGYGHIREDGTGTVDRRERKCLDCNGSGKRSSDAKGPAK